jgi:FAD/FMN-containing dehydrogenase
MAIKTFATLLCAAVATAASAAPSDVASACADIKAAAPGKLFYPQDLAYKLENTDYYNIGLAEMGPACILQATEASEVSAAVKILNKYGDVPFAVKSGGHDPNEGHSSVKGGVLIALSKMTFVKHEKGSRVAQFGPGGHWSDVIGPLDKKGAAVVGGRLGIVGVGGLVMQGGISFLSSQYGLAADVSPFQLLWLYITPLASQRVRNRAGKRDDRQHKLRKAP